jgi:hypothetical protein
MATGTVSTPTPTPPGAAVVAATTPLSPSKEPIKHYPQLYYWTLLLVGCAYAGVGGLVHYAGVSISINGEDADVGYLIFMIGAFHYIGSIKIVDRAYLGGVSILGIPACEVTGRFIIALWLICDYDEIELTPIEISVPTSPEKVWRGRDAGGKPLPIPVEGGYEEPLRVVFTSQDYEKLEASEPEVAKLISKGDPLLNRTTEEVSFVVRAAVQPGRFFDFYVRIRDYNNARVQIRALGIAKITEDFSKMSAAVALATLESNNLKLEEHLGKYVESWGVAIVNAKITIQLSYSMNSALEEIPEAQAKARATVHHAEGAAKATVLQSEADQTRLTNEGKGRAAADKAQLNATTSALKRRTKELELSGAEVLGAETARAIGQGPSDKIILGATGFVESLGIGKALAKTLGGKEESK